MDHLIYAGPDLDEAVARAEAILGMRAEIGGTHPGVGTRNAVIPFGERRYLEIIAPDPSQPDPPEGRWFGIDDLTGPSLVTWCSTMPRPHQAAALAAAEGLDLGEVLEGSRETPDGATLRWEVTDPRADRAGGVLPFFIDWLDTPHPGGGADRGVELLRLRAEHPEPKRVARWAWALRLPLHVVAGPVPRLRARLRLPTGLEVELD